MTEWGSHYSTFLLQIMDCPSLVVIYSSMILSLSLSLSVQFNSAPTTLRPESVRSLSFPCTSTTPPLLPLPWVCNRVWALGGRVESRSCTSTIYLLHLLACLLFYTNAITYSVLFCIFCSVYHCHLRGLFLFYFIFI